MSVSIKNFKQRNHKSPSARFVNTSIFARNNTTPNSSTQKTKKRNVNNKQVKRPESGQQKNKKSEALWPEMETLPEEEWGSSAVLPEKEEDEDESEYWSKIDKNYTEDIAQDGKTKKKEKTDSAKSKASSLKQGKKRKREEKEDKDVTNSDTFSATFERILGQALMTDETQEDPILKKRRVDKKRVEEKKQQKAVKEFTQKKKLLADKDHLIPDSIYELNDKQLKRLATRGVVKFFNAVRNQQRQTTEEEESKLKRKQAETVEKLSKGKFLDLLKASGRGINQQVSATAARKMLSNELEEKDTERNIEESWDVLKDNFLMKPRKADAPGEQENDSEGDQGDDEDDDQS